MSFSPDKMHNASPLQGHGIPDFQDHQRNSMLSHDAVLDPILSSPPFQDQSYHFSHQDASVTSLDHVHTPDSAAHLMTAGPNGIPGMQSLHRQSMDGADRPSPNSLFESQTLGSADSPSGADDAKGRPKDKSKDADSDAQPAWAELKTKAGKDRKRLPLACITCRRKKIRCSGEKPACRHCMRSRIPCVYKITTRKAAPRTDYMAMLDKRLKRMEERVIRIMPKDEQRNLDIIGRAVVKPALPGATAKPDTKKRVAEEAFGEELDFWASSSKAGVEGGGARGDGARDNLMTEGADFLPSPELQQHLAETYFDYVYGQSYTLLHKPSYMRKLEAGQLPPVIVLTVCAISARFSSHPEMRTDPAFLRGEQWAKPARAIALKRYDTPNITILICYLLLGLHEFGTCQGGRSWMLGGMAQRMAYALQLHKDPEPSASTGSRDDNNNDLTSTDREIRRRTMWACFMMDRFNSSGTDRPLFVSELYIDAQLPIKEQLFLLDVNGPTEKLDGELGPPVQPDMGQLVNARDNMGVAAYLTRAVCIWGQVVRYVNLGGMERDEHSMWSDESGFARVRKLIANWKANLPPPLHWSEENLLAHSNEKIGNQFIFMHIVINQVNLFLNRFALPISGNRPGHTKGMPPEFLNECARTALEAAGRISTLVNEAYDHRVVAPFAGYSAFFSSTVHIHGLSSQNPAIEAASKQYLAWNVKYLSNMKKYWGMFHFVTEHLKDLYRKQMDASMRPAQEQTSPTGATSKEEIFQYGDWFDRYPHGVSGTDYEDAAKEAKKEPATDALFGQKPDLQSVEEFFARMSPPNRARKMPKKKQSKSALRQATSAAAASGAGESNASKPQQEIKSADDSLTSDTRGFVGQEGLHADAPSGFMDMSHDVNLLPQAQGQSTGGINRPGVMSQLDRQMVLSSYARLNGSGQEESPSMSHAMAAGGSPLGFHDMDMGGGGFSFNTAAMQPGLEGWNDPTGPMSWFTPFNVDPPSGLGDETGMFGHGYDFSSLNGGGEGFGHLDGLGGVMEELGGGENVNSNNGQSGP